MFEGTQMRFFQTVFLRFVILLYFFQSRAMVKAIKNA